MVKKLQLKLLSQSGELLKVVTCLAGQITVFRANTHSDLRPYQRALSGASNKERFSISVDGTEYSPDAHTIIGLGEPAPHHGMTVTEFLTGVGLSDAATVALLSSIGLSDSAEKRCANLTPDEERRLRIVAATCTPNRIVILNEPFEFVASHWRESLAELLVSFVKDQSGMVVVTGMSYRPECWIDNESIARVQVGETLQKTVGFGGAGSQMNEEINRLRDAVRQDAASESANSRSTSAPAAIAVAAALTPSIDTGIDADSVVDPLLPQPVFASGSLDKFLAYLAGLPQSALIGIGGAGAVATVSAIYLAISGGAGPVNSSVPQSSTTAAASSQSSATSNGDTVVPVNDPGANTDGAPSKGAAAIKGAPQATSNFILDRYPAFIRTSLVETAQGIIPASIPSSPITNEPSSAKKPREGNLFKLLESASSAGTELPSMEGYAEPPVPYEAGQSSPSGTWPDPSTNQMPQDGGEEQQRREAIRQKFLDAIRASEERRQGMH